MGVAKILFLSDTHLGFDMPFRPRVERRRRGPDFFANYAKALEPARDGKVDCVVHGGDILYRSKVPAELVHLAFEPLKQLADRGMPIYVVPGNHERSAIPYGLLAQHPNIFLFDRPRTYRLDVPGTSLALVGFPSVRRDVRGTFHSLIHQTGWHAEKADAAIVCMHQAVEGATVGPADYVFRSGHDVIRAAELPAGFAAFLSGHIHRHQVLTKDGSGHPLPAPVLYPGSIERTSFAEKSEKKGFLILEIDAGGPHHSRLKDWRFVELPARPMVQVDLNVHRMGSDELRRSLKGLVDKLPADGVVQIRIHGHPAAKAQPILRAASLRTLAPPTMNVSVKLMDREFVGRRSATTVKAPLGV
jgi:DNA repair exonuclease SbcCD nuclease subunit